MKLFHFILIGHFSFFLLNFIPCSIATSEIVCEVTQKINSSEYEAHNCSIEASEDADQSIVFKFRPFSIIEVISFNESIISRFPQRLFKVFEVLQEVNMSQVEMTSIEENTFRNAKILKRLDLYGNLLRSIDDELFMGAKNLESLNLTKNLLTEVKCNAFKGLPQMKTLLLGENQISTLCPSLLYELQELSIFNVSYNRISIIPFDFFKNNIKIMEIDMSHNNLAKFDIQFQVFPVCYLNLNHNKLPSLSVHMNESNTIDCDAPVTLLSDSNSINELIVPETYRPEILSLKFNSLHDLHNITNKPSLKYLFLSGNPLNEEDIIQISNLTALQNLTLACIDIQHFNFGMLANLTQLLEFDISDNGLDELDLSVVSSLHELVRLNISNNQLMHIDEDYLRPHFPNLKFLDLNKNRWGCQYLQTMLHISFKRQRINALPQKGNVQVKNKPNIDGIACLQEVTTGHLDIFQRELTEIATKLTEDAKLDLKNDVERMTLKMQENHEELKKYFGEQIKNFEKRFKILETRLENLTQLNQEVMHRIIKLLDGE